MLADIFDAEIVTTNATQGTAFGAAMLAGIGAGVFKAEAATATIVATGSTEPNRQTHATYDSAFDLYRSLYPQLNGSFHAMAEFSN